jgi:hypothetical protein
MTRWNKLRNQFSTSNSGSSPSTVTASSSEEFISGEVLTIINTEPEAPLARENYPPGKLIALTDPSTAPLN